MAKFIDHHARAPQMSPEAMQEGMKVLQQVQADIKAGRADEFGVRPLNVFIGANGESWCLTEAPNAGAVISSHRARGAALTEADVVEVTSLA